MGDVVKAGGLADRLEQAIREHALSELPPDPSGEVAAMGLDDLLHTFGVWRDRLALTRPRRVHRSPALNGSTAAREHHAALAALVNKIATGQDLAPHLSGRVATAYVPASERGDKLHLRRDRDLLLADWGVHHLHLYVPHRNELLFVRFSADDAYLIGIFGHGGWADRAVLEVMVRAWPDVELMPASRIKGTRLSQTFTDDESRQLRNAGVAQLVEIDGKVYMPRGQTAAGTPLDVSRRLMNLRAQLGAVRDHEDEWTADNAQAVNEALGAVVTGEWEPVVHEGDCGFVRGGCFVPVAPLP